MFARSLGRLLVAAIVLSTLAAVPVSAQKSETAQPAGVPVIWRDPGDISRRNLTFGAGSSEQLRDAFRAANYDGQTMNGFIAVIRDRVNQLNKLSESVATTKR